MLQGPRTSTCQACRTCPHPPWYLTPAARQLTVHADALHSGKVLLGGDSCLPVLQSQLTLLCEACFNPYRHDSMVRRQVWSMCE